MAGVKKDRRISRKSPSSIFSKPDFYTVHDSDGNRNLELEHKLKEIEDKFITLRDKKLQQHQPLTPDDRKTIALFISTMYSRTKHQKEENIQIWQDYLETIETLPPLLATKIKTTPEYRHVLEQDSKQPMPFHMFHFVNLAAPILHRMNCIIYENKNEPDFITSDNPCIWLEPTLLYPNEPTTWYGLGSPKLNVLLPISPHQCISLMARGPDGYQIATDTFIDMVEEFIVGYADKYIIVSKNFSKESWFDKDPVQTTR